MPSQRSSTIRLESSNAIPGEFRKWLQGHESTFKRIDSIDQVLAVADIASLQNDLEAFLLTQRIQAYHCTRAPSNGYFEASGLRCTNLRGHQAEFLTNYGHHFTQAEIDTMQREWDGYFHQNTGGSVGRNGLIWICLSRPGVSDDGTDKFFTFFGGEAIYWPLVDGRYPCIAEKLRTIGQPVVVELAVPATDLHFFQPLARYVLSCHHKRLKPTVDRPEAEARLKRQVLSSEIIRVTPRANFVP